MNERKDGYSDGIVLKYMRQELGIVGYDGVVVVKVRMEIVKDQFQLYKGGFGFSFFVKEVWVKV